MKFLAIFLILFCAFGAASSSFACSECEYVASFVKVLLNSNQTVQHIENSLITYCNLFTGNSSSLCINFVTTKVPQLISLINQLDDPTKVCQSLRLCQTTSRVTSQVVLPQSATGCVICTYLVGLAEHWVAENATEQRILGIFESACNILPGSAKSICRAAVDQYGKEIIQLLIAKVDPSKVCQLLKACPAKTLVQAGPIPCYLCKYVVGTLESFVEQNSTEAEIIKLGEKICTILPSKLRPPCDSLVDVYITQAIHLILQKIDPTFVCTAIKLCTSSKADMLRPQVVQKIPASAQTCQICQFLLLTVEGYISANTTEQAIVGFAESFCQKLGPLSAVCSQFAQNEVPALIQTLLAKADPLAVCTKVGVCTASLRHLSVLSN